MRGSVIAWRGSIWGEEGKKKKAKDRGNEMGTRLIFILPPGPYSLSTQPRVFLPSTHPSNSTILIQILSCFSSDSARTQKANRL
jgi:hypothetical protein